MTATVTTDNSGQPDGALALAASAAAGVAHTAASAPGPAGPSVVYLLADHLDAVLARGEDLLATEWRPERLPRCAETIAEIQLNQRRTIDDIRTFEMALVARALKARDRSRELAARDQRFGLVARLFAAATASLDEAAREAGDATEQDFDTGDGILAYMRGRNMVAPDMATIDDCGSIVVTPAFHVARRIELGPLLDLVATFLDTLELHYDLYPEQLDATEADTAPADADGSGDGALSPVDEVAAPPETGPVRSPDAA